MTQELFESIYDSARVPRSLAGWRNVVGDIAERLVAQRLGATRQHTGMGTYCTDLKWNGWDIEVKACGRSNCIILYHVRLEKDRWWARNHTLLYAIVKHRVTVPQASALEVKELMSDSLLYLFPFQVIDAICATKLVKVINRNYKPSNGWCQRGYDQGGYHIPFKLLLNSFPHGYIPHDTST